MISGAAAMLVEEPPDARDVDDVARPRVTGQHIVPELIRIRAGQPRAGRRGEAALRHVDDLARQPPLRQARSSDFGRPFGILVFVGMRKASSMIR